VRAYGKRFQEAHPATRAPQTGIDCPIRRRPICAVGNSGGDPEMFQLTTMTGGLRLGLIVHHTDAVRECAYDCDSFVGRFDQALDQTPERGWVLVDMENEWRTVFPQ
jgi:hypothetical protein